MDRKQLLELWNQMYDEGNWVPSFPDTLNGVTAAEANWKPIEPSNSIWQEVVHIIFWRTATLNLIAVLPNFTNEEIATQEFAEPEIVDEPSWNACVALLKDTQDKIAALIPDESVNIERIPLHLIHDAYHLGRITQLRAMQGVAPRF